MLGILEFIILVGSLIFKAITVYFQIKFKELVEYNMSKRQVEKYLHQPYEWFLNNHTAELGKTILSEISNVCSQGIRPLIEIIARSIVSILLLILLFLTDPKLTLVIGLLIGGIYYLIFFFSKKYLNLIGEENLLQNHLRYKSIIDAFGASKKQKLWGVQIPLALPNIMQGINQCTMMALSMVVIASMIGTRGLGDEVLLGLQQLNVGRAAEAGIAIVLLAIVLDRITQSYGETLQERNSPTKTEKK